MAKLKRLANEYAKISVQELRRKILFVGVVLTGGCTHLELQQESAELSTTLTEIQYQQVLNNIALFESDNNALPSLVRLSGGAAQVSDTVSPGFSISWEAMGRGTPGLEAGAERQWTLNWDLVPVTSPSDLRQLRALFRRAVGAIEEQEYRDQWRVGALESTVTTKPTTAPAVPQNWYTLQKPAKKDVAYTGRYRKVTVYVLHQDTGKLADFVLATLGSAPIAAESAQKGLLIPRQTLINP